MSENARIARPTQPPRAFFLPGSLCWFSPSASPTPPFLGGQAMAEADDDAKQAEALIYLLVVIAAQAILLGLLLPPSFPLGLEHLTRQTITGADIFLLGLLVTFSGSTVFAL